jgi:hypothetical protein
MGKPDQPRNPDGTWRARSSWSLAGLVAVAALVGLGTGSGAAGVAGGGASAGGGTVAERSASGSQGGGAQVRARAKSTTRVVQRLRSRGLRVSERGVDADDDCAAHSYGQVREFFGRQPCTALYRALFEVRDGRVTVVVAVAWVDMPDDDQARRLQQLVDRNGTGNLTELTKEGRGPRSVQWTGQHYTSARDGVTFVNAQAEPVGSTARAIGLAESVAMAAVG